MDRLSVVATVALALISTAVVGAASVIWMHRTKPPTTPVLSTKAIEQAVGDSSPDMDVSVRPRSDVSHE
jgi:hypothetical protein